MTEKETHRGILLLFDLRLEARGLGACSFYRLVEIPKQIFWLFESSSPLVALIFKFCSLRNYF